jgi:hypothetical protein
LKRAISTNNADDIQQLNVFIIILKRINISHKLICCINLFKIEQQIPIGRRIEIKRPLKDKISK